MMDEIDLDDSVIGSPFYTYRRKDGLVWLGVVIPPFGNFALSFKEEDWIDWLREEMRKCHPVKIPSHLER